MTGNNHIIIRINLNKNETDKVKGNTIGFHKTNALEIHPDK